MYEPSEIAARIRAKSRERGIPLRDLISRCGLGINSISQMAAGSMPRADSLARIADVLDCSVDYLLGRSADFDIRSVQ